MIFHLGGILIEREASIPRLGDALCDLITVIDTFKEAYDRSLFYRKKVSSRIRA